MELILILIMVSRDYNQDNHNEYWIILPFLPNPYAPCMEYLSTFAPKITQM